MSSSQNHSVREALADNVTKYRKQNMNDKGRPWTQSQLAEKCGMSLGTIQKIEAGVSWPDWKTVLKIAEVLKVDVNSLYSKEVQMSFEEALKIVNKTLGINLQPARENLHIDQEFFFENLKLELDSVKKTMPDQVHNALENLVEKIRVSVG